MQQLVEVAKATALEARLIIMDEPTSSLSEKEIAELFTVIRDLRRQGLGIVFISHKLSELFAIADRVTILRDGAHIATRGIDEVDADEIIKMMVGRELSHLYPPRGFRDRGGRVRVRASQPFRRRAATSASRSARRDRRSGGSGRRRPDRGHARADQRRPRSSGTVPLAGEPVTLADPREAAARGIVYVSEDRKGSGLFLPSIRRRISAPHR